MTMGYLPWGELIAIGDGEGWMVSNGPDGEIQIQRVDFPDEGPHLAGDDDAWKLLVAHAFASDERALDLLELLYDESVAEFDRITGVAMRDPDWPIRNG